MEKVRTTFGSHKAPRWCRQERYVRTNPVSKVFARLFQKAARIQRRGALVARRNARNFPCGIFFLLARSACRSGRSVAFFHFVPLAGKRKKACKAQNKALITHYPSRSDQQQKTRLTHADSLSFSLLYADMQKTHSPLFKVCLSILF